MNEFDESSKEALKKEVIYHIYSVILNMWIDLSVRGDGLNMGCVYMGSGKIRVRCILGSGKIRVMCILVLQVSDQPNRFKVSFGGYFFFC